LTSPHRLVEAIDKRQTGYAHIAHDFTSFFEGSDIFRAAKIFELKDGMKRLLLKILTRAHVFRALIKVTKKKSCSSVKAELAQYLNSAHTFSTIILTH